MTRIRGVWLDHTRARVFDCGPEGTPTMETIESGVEPVRQSTGHIHNVPPGHGVGVVRHGAGERRFEQQLQRFYRDVAARLKGSRRVVVLGPGPARDEFAAFLRQDPELSKALKAVEPVDARLTEAQIVARARELLKE